MSGSTRVTADRATADPPRPRRPDRPRPLLRDLRAGLDRLAREIRGGLVTFFTMAYIVVLNPLIIGTVPDADGNFLGGGDAPEPGDGGRGDRAGRRSVLTILMGVVANFPLALATGLGLNAFVAYSIASQMSWADAMGLVVIEGLVILVLVLTGFRKAVFHAVPTGAEGRDQRRHRAVHRLHRAGRRRRRAAQPGRREHAGPGRLRRRRRAGRLADARVRPRPARDHRPDGPAR